MSKVHRALLAGGLTLAALSAQAQDGNWAIKKPLAAPRNEVQLVALDGKVYVIGGSVAGNAVPQIDEYDPAADIWRARALMPKGLDHLGAIRRAGSILTTSTIRKPTPGRRDRRCQPRAADLPPRFIRA